MPNQTTQPEADGLAPFGWAGYLLSIPNEWRPLKMTGDARAGSFILGDDDAAKLRVTWSPVTRRRFNAEKTLRRAIARPIKGVPIASDAKSQGTKLAGFDASYCVQGKDGSADRCVAYSANASRVVDVIYHHGDGRELKQYRTGVLPTLRDQPVDQPHKWAYFDCSFVAPAGMFYGVSKLNLGDMRVRVFSRGGELFGPSLMVRQIYPATLALARLPIESWVRACVRDDRHHVRPVGGGLVGKGVADTTPWTCARGEGMEAFATLNWRARPIFIRAPRRWRYVIFQDKAVDRLVVIQAAHKNPALRDAMIDEAIKGLHWATPV